MVTPYDVVTDRIVKALDKGTVPWHKPWKGGEAGSPKNLASGKAYRGINVWMLHAAGYTSPYWLTFKQAKALKGSVKRGEHGFPVVFWKFKKDEETDTEEKQAKSAPILRYYTVFNVDQCEGVECPQNATEPQKAFNPIEEAETLAKGYHGAPVVTHNEARAYYRPATDAINMPKRETFDGAQEYYSTLFHEYGHSTGHESRLNRKTLTDLCPFGSTNYSSEELVAEMTAAFLCGQSGIENRTIDNSAAYIAGWKSKLKNEPKCLVIAAAQAQKAADWIRGIRA